MFVRIFTTLILIVFLFSSSQAQRLKEFSDNKTEFYQQLEDYMTSSKRKVMEETFEDFGNQFQAGGFSAEEQDSIMARSNQMLQLRMKASPYFKNYLISLNHIKSFPNGAATYKEWDQVLSAMIQDVKGGKLKSIKTFLEFSTILFKEYALKYSDQGGVNWKVLGDSLHIVYDSLQPQIVFEKVNLLATRKQDSIFIENTGGIFYPLQNKWVGKSGRAGWQRHGLDRDHYAQFKDYEIDMSSTSYKVNDAIIYLPSLFKDEALTGTFEDKLISGSYKSFPRFISSRGIAEMKGIGEGIQFFGQFGIEGLNLTGLATKEENARLLISDKKGALRIQGQSKSFTIKKGEVIYGKEVELSLYIGKDSIYHPSINFRFDIEKRIAELTRGEKSNDRNDFSSSYHQIDIDTDKMIWYFDQDSLVISEKAKAIGSEVEKRNYYSSKEYFSEKEYRRLQAVATVNPIATLKVLSDMQGSRSIDATTYAKRLNPRYSIENIQSMLYDMVSKGFIQYDQENELIDVFDKVYLYADAKQNKIDYDNLRIISETNKTSGILNTADNSLEVNGIKFIEFSESQMVATKTDSGQIKLLENRNIDFDGKIYASLGIFQGTKFHFDYDQFQIRMDSIATLDLFEQTDKKDENGNPLPKAIGSRLQNLSGVLLIDAPSNKSGKEDIDIFPSFQSKSSSYVYYDAPDHLDTTYNREDFNFELNDFSLNSMDKLSREDMNFKGTMKSSGIFPEFKETLTLQPDESLGFVTQTPSGGYPIYGDKGRYTGEISLNNKGFTGMGKLNYLSAEISSEDFAFMPKLMTGSADQFSLTQNKSTNIPTVLGGDIKFALNPYSDSLEIRTKGDPFKIYQEGDRNFAGTLVLTPEGLRGDGDLTWDRAIVNSKYFNFGTNSAKSDTMKLSIWAIDAEDFAISTGDLNGSVDFDKQIGQFKSNKDTSYTTLPYNQYVTTMNEFTWDMAQENISFKSGAELADFISIHPNQDSLIFSGNTAFYDLKESKLNVGGVPYIKSCDAFIYPDKGLVFVQPGGVIDSFENARIIADTANQNHVINRAKVRIGGRKSYKAEGYYEYNIGPHEQEIFLSDIVGDRIGKGKRSEKATETRAKGVIAPEENFYIDHKTQYRGDIALKSSNVNLQFDGYAKLDAPKMGEPEWFTINSEGNKNDLTIGFNIPRNYAGDKLYTGFYLSRQNVRIYPRILMPIYSRKDRKILPVTGVFKFDEEKDEFIFGDSTKIIQNQYKGNKLVFSNKTGKVKGEGLLNICSELDYIKVKAAGTIETEFATPNSNDTTAMDPLVSANMVAGIDMIVPENCIRFLVNDIQSSSFDAQDIIYALKEPFYNTALAEFISDTTSLNQTLVGMKTQTLAMPPKYKHHTFLFTDLPMKWDPDYQSFVSSKALAGLGGIGKTMLNKMIECYVEFKMPTKGDDRIYIYFKSPSGYFYFFSYRGGIMGAVSDNTRFNDILRNLKGKEALIKMPDGNKYEIQNLEPNSANRFLARAKAAIEK